MKLPVFAFLRWSTVASFVCGVLCTAVLLKYCGLIHSPKDFVVWKPWDKTIDEKVVGRWLLDDLRTPEVDDSCVVFGPHGYYKDEMNSPHGETRWFSNGGVIYFTANGMNRPDGKDYLFGVVPEFDDSGDAFTIAFENIPPHCRLIRVSGS